MKKIVMLLIAAVMLFGVSGQAMAAFSDGDLIQVVYQKGGTAEVATDLGAVSLGTTAYTGPTINFNANPFPTAGSGVFATASQSDLQVAYYIAGGTAGSAPAYVSGSNATQTSAARQGAKVGNLTVQNTMYNTVSGGGSQASVLQNNIQSYYSLSDAGGNTIGGFGGFIPVKDGEVSLGTSAYVDTYLYYYATPNATSSKAGVQVATIRTFANGSSQVVGPVTPIPASILLLGSGLAGLVGIRRKQSA